MSKEYFLGSQDNKVKVFRRSVLPNSFRRQYTCCVESPDKYKPNNPSALLTLPLLGESHPIKTAKDVKKTFTG